MLRTIARQCKVSNDSQIEFIFCGDTVRKKLDRLQVDETYKVERPSLTNLNFYIFRNVMSYVIKDLGCEIVQHEGAEGDDVIASLVHKFSKKCDCAAPCKNCKCSEQDPYSHIVIMSCDRDHNSLLAYRNVSIHRQSDLFYTRADFVSEFCFEPTYFPIYKALVGDKSDGIKGVALWGDARAKKHIEQKNWEETLKKDGTFDEFERALALVTLRIDISNLPDCGCKITIGGCSEMVDKLKAEYHNQDAIEDVIFGEKRLEAACKTYSSEEDIIEQNTNGGKVDDNDKAAEADFPF